MASTFPRPERGAGGPLPRVPYSASAAAAPHLEAGLRAADCASRHGGRHRCGGCAQVPNRWPLLMSSMSCYTLAEGGSIFPSGDELAGNQKTEQGNYWTQWNSRLSDDLNTTSLYSDEHENGIEQCFDDAEEHERSSQQERSSACPRVASSDCSTGPSEEHSEGPAPLELQHSKETNDIFLSQFSDDEMRMMDAPFQALDMFPGSMHRLLSYENMLSGVLTDSQNQETNPGHNEMDTMDTCGFPLFSHDLQNDPSSADGSLQTLLSASQDKAEVSTMKRSRSVADIESSSNGEVAVLEELEDVMFQLTKKTRVCLRDAFYRLAESSEAQCTAVNGGTLTCSNEQSFQQSEGTESSTSTSDRAERETNAIDRTVAILAFKPACSAAWE
uniref:Protein LNK3 n=1 Tax=Triticum urartu TaxID=4572 RepID=A0A8R7JWW3_TRIUA